MTALTPSELRDLVLAVAVRLDEGGQSESGGLLRDAASDGCTAGEWLGGIGAALRAAAAKAGFPTDLAAEIEQIEWHVRRAWPEFRVCE